MHLKATIPPELLARIEPLGVLEVGFGAGPSCIAGKVEQFDAPVPLDGPLAWLEGYLHVMKRGHVLLADHTVLWFAPPQGFYKYEETPRPARPRTGVTTKTTD